MDKIIFEVEEQDRIFIENECEKHLHTFDSFFKLLLNEYRMHRIAQVPRSQPETPIAQESTTKDTKKPMRKHEKNSGEA